MLNTQRFLAIGASVVAIDDAAQFVHKIIGVLIPMSKKQSPQVVLERQRRYPKSHTLERKAWRSSSEGKYCLIRANAKTRGIFFDLTYEEFVKVFIQPCFVTKCARTVTGLDRIDSSIGYLINNVRAACKDHNTLKMYRSDEETYVFSKRICRVVYFYSCKESLSRFEGTIAHYYLAIIS